MLSTKSVGYSALFVLALGATIQPSVNATSFAGMYTRSNISPSGCSDSNSCEYQCAASYTISTSGSTAWITPTGYASGCECDTIATNISGDYADGMGYNMTSFSSMRTPTGLTVVTEDSGLNCTSTYYYTTTYSNGAAQVGGALGWAIAATSAVVLSFF